MSFTPEQRAERAAGIGGSEAAAALGLSNTVTPIDLYRHKVYGEPLYVNADEMALWLGHQLEPVVAAAFEKHTGMELLLNHRNHQNDEHPFIRGYPDRIVKGKPEGVELKAWSEFSRSLWGPDGSDEVPMAVLCQCVHYMIATGFDCWHVGVLLGTEFRHYTIYRDEKVIEDFTKGEVEFWGYVQRQEAPPAINVKDLHYLYSVSKPDSNREATAEEVKIHRALSEAKAQAKNCELRMNDLEFKLKQSMADTARLTQPGNHEHTLVTWREHTTTRPNTEALKKQGLFDAFSEESTVRQMRLGEPA